MELIWDTHSQAQWGNYLQRIGQSNLIQTWAYARAVRGALQRMTRFGLIRDAGQDVGILQMQEQRLLGFHYLTLDRGPLWFDGTDAPGLWPRFITALAAAYPRRFGRVRRLLPECPPGPEMALAFQQGGFVRRGEGYRTYWVDLTQTPLLLRAALEPKWRNHLNASERAGLLLSDTCNATVLAWLIQRYVADRAAKSYRGPSPAMLRALVDAFTPGDNVLLLRAFAQGAPCAAVLIFLHGRAATYQIGWADELGRRTSATNFLLWRAMLRLQQSGIEWFDLGGIHAQAAPGVTRYKQGLGGKLYETVGSYR